MPSSRFTIPFPAASTRVRIAREALAHLGRETRRTTGATRVALVTDTHVGPLYAAAACRALARAGIETHLVTVPAGERSKRIERLAGLWRRFDRAPITRADAVVALGGGVVGDLAGFAAATWLRGVPWVGVPTSLLAMVDSAIGGKTGIDLASGKNLVGAFHQPALVIVDPAVLATLPARHRRAGLAEVVKMGFACDAALFRFCERHAAALAAGRPVALAAAITRSLRVKTRVVTRDERDRGPRSALNFGHTLAHAYETARGYRGVLHGEAVAVGMCAAARLSVRIAGLDPGAWRRLERLLATLGLPRRLDRVRATALEHAMRHDKKRGTRDTRWVLTPRMGHASVPQPITTRLVRATLLDVGARI
ncbi:MAG TPA: 3-dehydroquinate synthase [Dongiaceae bacterium]|nr:3-dehydroquinate synthase [Dongiaceae bacterium]